MSSTSAIAKIIAEHEAWWAGYLTRLRASWRVCPEDADHPRRPACTDPACLEGGACQRRAARGLDDAGTPMPKAARPACGAHTRAGTPCSARVVPGKRRCRLHGGLSTGPRTAEGRARIAEATRRRNLATRTRDDDSSD